MTPKHPTSENRMTTLRPPKPMNDDSMRRSSTTNALVECGIVTRATGTVAQAVELMRKAHNLGTHNSAGALNRASGTTVGKPPSSR